MGLVKFLIKFLHLNEIFDKELNKFLSIKKTIIYLAKYKYKHIFFNFYILTAFVFIQLIYNFLLNTVCYFINVRVFYAFYCCFIFFKNFCENNLHFFFKYFCFVYFSWLKNFFLENLFFLKYINYYLKYISYHLKILLYDDFLFKFFFNIHQPADIYDYWFIISALFNNYIFKYLYQFHIWMLEAPAYGTYYGYLNPRWVIYSMPFYAIPDFRRWLYPSKLRVKYTNRFYYREKIFFSYLRDFFYVHFLLKLINLIWDMFRLFFVYIKKISSILIIIFLIISLPFDKLFLPKFRCFFLYRPAYYFNFITPVWKIYNKIWLMFLNRLDFLFKNINFGRGRRFRWRISIKDAFFIRLFKRFNIPDSSGRFKYRRKLKKLRFINVKRWKRRLFFSKRRRPKAIKKKRRFRPFKVVFKTIKFLVKPVFKLFFKPFLFVLKFFYSFLPIHLYLINYFWSFFADICFVC